MRSFAFPLVPVLGAVLAACVTPVEDGAEDRRGRVASPIINGNVDTAHPAVVAVLGFQSACTGTIVHLAPPSAFVLTAAHCFGPGPPVQIRIGNNFNAPNAVLDVVDHREHPSYNAQNQSYDFGMVRATGASAGTPWLPPLSPAEDKLAPGTQIRHVGYGLVSYPNGQTTVRHEALGKVNQVATIQFDYLQPTSGPCSGDSGGPNLTVGDERVAGVISFGDQQCNQFGVSGRVSAVHNGFIMAYIEEQTGSSSAVTTTSTGVGGGGTTSSSGVGGATASSSVGVGATGASDDWIAGDADDRRYDGELLTSDCSVATPGGRAGSAFAALALAVLTVSSSLRGRRRPRSSRR
jgi:hypothetical protein